MRGLLVTVFNRMRYGLGGDLIFWDGNVRREGAWSGFLGTRLNDLMRRNEDVREASERSYRWWHVFIIGVALNCSWLSMANR